MPMKAKTRYSKKWERLRYKDIKEYMQDYEDDFEPLIRKRSRGGYVKAKERTPILIKRR